MKLSSLDVMNLVFDGLTMIFLIYAAIISPRVVADIEGKLAMPEPYLSYCKRYLRRICILGAILLAIAMLLEAI